MNKTELLNAFFIGIYSIIQNRSKLPTDFVTQTDQCLASTTFSKDEVLKIIQSLDLNKSHDGTQTTSVRMIKL